MSGPKPCLGYRSRSEAIRALRDQGLTTEAIAEKTGIPKNKIGALESYGKHGRDRQGRRRLNGSRPIGADGLFEGEREILRLWDAGNSREEIIEQTGAARSYVFNVISRLDVGGEDPWKTEVRQSTAALLAALQAVHPECRGRAQ